MIEREIDRVNSTKILLLGTGELGGIVLELLARSPDINAIIIAGKNKEIAFQKANSAILGASYLGLWPEISHAVLDLTNAEALAEFLHTEQPDIIFNATTIQSLSILEKFPSDEASKIYNMTCGIAPWVAAQLPLIHNVMRAVAMSGVKAHIVNAASPDIINASLGRLGMAPTIGVGNMHHIVPYLQRALAVEADSRMDEFNVELIAHHSHSYFWCRYGTGADIPHFLRITQGGRDYPLTPDITTDLVASLPRIAMRPPGRLGEFLVAASSVQIIRALLAEEPIDTHASGPLGLEGGYPVTISRRGIDLRLPMQLDRIAARELMIGAQRYDGVDAITDAGDIMLTEAAHQNLLQSLNIDWQTITVASAAEQAVELKEKLVEALRRIRGDGSKLAISVAYLER